jgi:hypothetical protein
MTQSSPTRNEQCPGSATAASHVCSLADDDLIVKPHSGATERFFPSSFSGVQRFEFLDEEEAGFLTEIQGRTYVNMAAFLDCFLRCKSASHQEAMCRIEQAVAAKMPNGYIFLPKTDHTVRALQPKSRWALLALALLIQSSTHAHFLRCLEPDSGASLPFTDVCAYRWKQQLDSIRVNQLECLHEYASLEELQREQAAGELIAFIVALDGLVKAQAGADVEYFLKASKTALYEENAARMRTGVLQAYRWLYFSSGVQEHRFQHILRSTLSCSALERIDAASTFINSQSGPAESATGAVRPILEF